MAEYIILNLTKDEERILEENDIEFLIDNPFDLNKRDINIECSKRRFEEILSLIGRNNSYQ